ncbi:MAG TPA: hypothetical protein VJC17_03660 [Candidatus Dojkabacteria bacterium]|nr:hypothetical protein [Candidatus Dojkabacteria bacterium]
MSKNFLARIFFGISIPLVFISLMAADVFAATPIPTPTKGPGVDPKCAAYLLTHDYSVTPPCNEVCASSCLELGRSCKYVDGDIVKTNNICFDLEETALDPVTGSLNIFGIDIPYDKAIWVLSRAGLLLVFAVISLISIGLVIQAMYLRSTSQGEPEKIEESAKIFRNAVIGLVITFGAVLITQVFALFVGISDSIFDLTVIPKLGLIVKLSPEEIEKQVCRPEQKGVQEGVGNLFVYICENNKWIQAFGEIADGNINPGGLCTYGSGRRIGKDKDDNLYECKQVSTIFPLANVPLWIAVK